MTDNNVTIIARIKGVPAKPGTPETDRDPQNPNLPPEFAALGITEGESVVIPRSQYEAYRAAAKVLLKCEDRYSMQHIDAEQCRAGTEALASLRSAGIEIEDKTP